jgi:hypothetical protein
MQSGEGRSLSDPEAGEELLGYRAVGGWETTEIESQVRVMGSDWLESGSKILVWTNFCDVGVGLELTGEVAKIFGFWIEFKMVFCR